MSIVYDLSLTKNMYGKPVSPDYAIKIMAYIHRPTPDGWDDIQGIILIDRPLTTIWLAVLEIDPTFPRRGRQTDQYGNVTREWDRLPTIEQVQDAITFVTH